MLVRSRYVVARGKPRPKTIYRARSWVTIGTTFESSEHSFRESVFATGCNLVRQRQRYGINKWLL
jgi:hypothetical protein